MSILATNSRDLFGEPTRWARRSLLPRSMQPMVRPDVDESRRGATPVPKLEEAIETPSGTIAIFSKPVHRPLIASTCRSGSIPHEMSFATSPPDGCSCGLEVDRVRSLDCTCQPPAETGSARARRRACVAPPRHRKLAVPGLPGRRGTRQSARRWIATISRRIVPRARRLGAADGDVDRRRLVGKREDARVVDAVVLALVRVEPPDQSARMISIASSSVSWRMWTGGQPRPPTCPFRFSPAPTPRRKRAGAHHRHRRRLPRDDRRVVAIVGHVTSETSSAPSVCAASAPSTLEA